MKALFKEKTYESYFLAELARKTNVLYSPDQVDEALLGFDGAFFLRHSDRRGPFPYIRLRRRGRLIGMSASEIDGIGETLDSSLPTFRLNLFVQYKRPEWLSRNNASEWSTWCQPYYRYKIEGEQQKRLEAIITAAGDRAAVVYAAAAFHESSDLFRYSETGKIIENSNIVSAAFLTDHSKFTYIRPGSCGVAHSDPEPVEGPAFASLLEGMAKNEGQSFTKQLQETTRTIEMALRRDETAYALWEASKRAIIGGGIDELSPAVRETWLDAAISVSAFTQAFDTDVIAVG